MSDLMCPLKFMEQSMDLKPSFSCSREGCAWWIQKKHVQGCTLYFLGEANADALDRELDYREHAKARGEKP